MAEASLEERLKRELEIMGREIDRTLAQADTMAEECDIYAVDIGKYQKWSRLCYRVSRLSWYYSKIKGLLGPEMLSTANKEKV